MLTAFAASVLLGVVATAPRAQAPERSPAELMDAVMLNREPIGGPFALTDQHGNSITMNKDGIELKSAKKFTIDASGDVEIKGSKVDVK